MADENIRRDDQLLCGRLVAMPSTQTTKQMKRILTNTRGFDNVISVDFPAMPDTIELARSADYNVNYNIVMPDGIHQYKGTKPMEIPISFKLHSFDQQYCKKGALTLLQLAARLHSFILPISTFGPGVEIAAVANTDKKATGKAADANTEAAASQENVYEVVGVGGNNVGAIYSPVTCWLHLMWVGNQQPGISAVGYVREVKVVFNGPWLRGPAGSFNLPTSADFSFVFVHRPGHNNNQKTITSQFPPTLTQSGQAYADDVRGKLYNTRDLVYAANYQGFGNNPSNLTTGAVLDPGDNGQ